MKGTQDCDITLKSLISEGGAEVLNYLAGAGRVKAWLNVELPQVRNPRVDLLAMLESGGLIHIELQSTNEMTPQRMLEYGVGVWRQESAFPRQLLLYVGNEPMRIINRVRFAGLDYEFQLVDFRTLDGDAMLESDSIAVNILSVLAGSTDRVGAIRRIIMKIAALEVGARADALRKLLILAGLRRVAFTVEEESKNMPVTFDIMDNEVLGPAIRKGLETGRAEGRQEGRQEGLQEGERRIFRMLLEKQFGALPGWVEERLARLSLADIEALALRLHDTHGLDELFST